MVSDVTNSTATMTTSSKVRERAATARSHTSVAKIRLVVVVAYTASDFIVISGYISDVDFKYWLLTKNGRCIFDAKTFPVIFV